MCAFRNGIYRTTLINERTHKPVSKLTRRVFCVWARARERSQHITNYKRLNERRVNFLAQSFFVVNICSLHASNWERKISLLRFTMSIYYLIFSHLFRLSLIFWCVQFQNRARTISIKKYIYGNDVKIEKQTHVTFCCCRCILLSLDITRTNSITHWFFLQWNTKWETHSKIVGCASLIDSQHAMHKFTGSVVERHIHSNENWQR